MKKKTQKEVVKKYQEERLNLTTIQLIRYARVYHHCTKEEAIQKIKESLDKILLLEPEKVAAGETNP
jgi:endonuclease IV